MEKRNATGKDVCRACGGTGTWVDRNCRHLENISTGVCLYCGGTGKRVLGSNRTVKDCSYLRNTTQVHFYHGSKKKKL